MAYANTHWGAKISPTKVGPVIGLIRGMRVDQALSALRMSKKRAAVFIQQALRAAIANADQAEVDVRRLVVSDARVDGGPIMKRWQPKDRGRAHPIWKRTSHITVAVEER